MSISLVIAGKVDVNLSSAVDYMSLSISDELVIAGKGEVYSSSAVI